MKRTPLNRRTPLKKANAKRKRARFARAYGSGDNVARVQSMACIVCNRTPSEAAHVRSRGAGGTWRDIVPLCRDHHREQHAIGIQTFEATYGLDLAAIAAHINPEES
jgi:hypothetical protein